MSGSRALDMSVDTERFRFKGALHYHMEFPSRASRDPWIRLLNQFPNSALSAVARVRLAIFQAREGRIDDAIALLTEVEQFAETQDDTEGQSADLFGAEAPEASLGVDLDLTVTRQLTNHVVGETLCSQVLSEMIREQRIKSVKVGLADSRDQE